MGVIACDGARHESDEGRHNAPYERLRRAHTRNRLGRRYRFRGAQDRRPSVTESTG